MSVTKENTSALEVSDDTRDIETNRINEKVIMDENTSKIERQTHGHSFILGSSVNGVLGVANGEDGSQIVLGSAGRVLSVLAVVNPNNIYRERFKDASFEDTGVTTADWADTPGTLVMTAGEVAKSSSIAYNNGTITRATLNGTFIVGNPALLITIQLSADGGSHFENVTYGVEHTFLYPGNDLRFRLVSAFSVTMTLITVSYS